MNDTDKLINGIKSLTEILLNIETTDKEERNLIINIKQKNMVLWRTIIYLF